jgi:hypothetical protein
MMVDDDDDHGRGGNGFNNTNGTAQTFASTFRSNAPGAARTAEELRRARESRAADALTMKDEQIALLAKNNNELLKQLEVVSEYCASIPSQAVIDSHFFPSCNAA